MPDNPDWVARAIGGASFVVSGLALWLNWQKNERDLAALRPQVGVSIARISVRRWRVRLTVTNPLLVPITWQKVRAVSPPGLGIADTQRIDDFEAKGFKYFGEFEEFKFIPNAPATIEPKHSHVWEGYAEIDDHYAVGKNAVPVVEPWVDGFDYKPGLLRRMASRIWPSAIRI